MGQGQGQGQGPGAQPQNPPQTMHALLAGNSAHWLFGLPGLISAMGGGGACSRCLLSQLHTHFLLFCLLLISPWGGGIQMPRFELPGHAARSGLGEG